MQYGYLHNTDMQLCPFDLRFKKGFTVNTNCSKGGMGQERAVQGGGEGRELCTFMVDCQISCYVALSSKCNHTWQRVLQTGSKNHNKSSLSALIIVDNFKGVI